jgi:hypothetical protein
MRDGKDEPSSHSVTNAIGLAIITALAGYSVGVLDDHRKRQIDFVDQQIEKLYGPLSALSRATSRAKQDLLALLRPGKTDYFDEHDPPKPQEVVLFVAMHCRV